MGVALMYFTMYAILIATSMRRCHCTAWLKAQVNLINTIFMTMFGANSGCTFGVAGLNLK